MINGLNAAGNQFLASIETLQNQMNTAETDLSSGLRVNKASDAPQSVADIFQARADLGERHSSETRTSRWCRRKLSR